MIITFCGHSNCLFSDEEKEELKQLIIKEIRKNPTCKFYLGGYGDFDSLCLRTLRELKKEFQIAVWRRVAADNSFRTLGTKPTPLGVTR